MTERHQTLPCADLLRRIGSGRVVGRHRQHDEWRSQFPI